MEGERTEVSAEKIGLRKDRRVWLPRFGVWITLLETRRGEALVSIEPWGGPSEDTSTIPPRAVDSPELPTTD